MYTCLCVRRIIHCPSNSIKSIRCIAILSPHRFQAGFKWICFHCSLSPGLFPGSPTPTAHSSEALSDFQCNSKNCAPQKSLLLFECLSKCHPLSPINAAADGYRIWPFFSPSPTIFNLASVGCFSVRLRDWGVLKSRVLIDSWMETLQLYSTWFKGNSKLCFTLSWVQWA